MVKKAQKSGTSESSEEVYYETSSALECAARTCCSKIWVMALSCVEMVWVAVVVMDIGENWYVLSKDAC